MPSRSASSRLDQCVTPRLFGGGVNVAVITFARSTRSRPPRRPDPVQAGQPSRAYRLRHRFTVGRVTPTRSAIS